MNCVKCGSPTKYNEPSLCSVCEDEAIANAAVFKRLFVDSNIARDTKKIINAVIPRGINKISISERIACDDWVEEVPE